MAKKPKTTKALVPVATAVQHRPLAGTDIMPVEVYRVPGRLPPGGGPWSAEPDKVSWIDPATGMPCIMRRGTDGALRGYVGVGPDHPLAGVGEEALPHDPPIIVHGGVDYASPCEKYEPHETSVCHVRVSRAAAGRSSTPLQPPFDARTMVALAMLPEELWWFGFSYNKPYDPDPREASPCPVGSGEPPCLPRRTLRRAGDDQPGRPAACDRGRPTHAGTQG